MVVVFGILSVLRAHTNSEGGINGKRIKENHEENRFEYEKNWIV